MKNLIFTFLNSLNSFVKRSKYFLLLLLLFAIVFNIKNKVKDERVVNPIVTKTKVISPLPANIKEVNSTKTLSPRSSPIGKLIATDKNVDSDATGTDTAMYQNFKMTSDPALGYPPYDRMRIVRDLIDNSQSSGNKAIQGMNWYERGSNSCAGRTRAIMWDPLDPTHKKVWAGGANGGLWYTNDITLDPPSFGNPPPHLQWNNVTDIWSNLAINCIAFDEVSIPSNAKYYVGTGEGFIATTLSPTQTIAPVGGGIWESSNGINWSVIPNTVPGGPNTMFNFNYIQKISFLAGTNPNISDMYVGTYNDGILKRDNSGLWTKVLGNNVNGAISNQVADIEVGFGNTYKLYAAMGLSATDGIYGYNQSLNTWVNLCLGNGFPTNFKRICLATDPLNPNTLYALVSMNSIPDIKFYKSINEGTTWINLPFGAINPGNSQIGYCMSLGVSPGGSVIYAGGVGQVISNDGGSTWVQLPTGNGFHVDQHDIQFQANEAILCNDGGIYYSSDASMSIGQISLSHKSEGFNVSQLYSCAIKNVANDSYYIFGSQDNGAQISDGSNIISNTIQKIKGDGGFCFVDQDQPNIQIASHQGSTGFKYSVSSGNGFAPFDYTTSSNNYFSNCSFIVAADYDSRENIFFQQHTETIHSGDDCGFLRLLKFSNVGGGGPNQNIGFNQRNKIDLIIPSTWVLNMTAFKVLPINPQPNVSTVFFGTDNGKLYKVPNIPNNGQDLTINAVSLNSPLAGQGVSVSSIEIGTNEDQILVTFSNFGISSVWETKDGGITWEDKDAPTQTNPSLPDMPIYWAIYNPNNTNEVLLATEAGIWSTDNLNELPYPIWGFNTASNCPKTSFRMLKYRTADNLVVAASHGRGLWASEVFKHPVANFTVTQSQPCPGLAVNFTNTSTVNPTSYLWDFGDGTTSTLVSPTHFYAIPGTYTCKLIVSNAFGTSSFTQTVNATLNCCTGDVDLLDGKNASDYLSDLIGPQTTYLVKGKFYIDVNGLNLIGKDFIAEPGAEIIVNDGIAFYATNCNFYACSDMWQGISVRNESKLALENCAIKDANTGVAPNFQASFGLTNCHFENNIYGVYASIDYGYPDKEGSFDIIGCSFKFNTALKLPYLGQTAYGTMPKAGVYMRFRHGIIGNNNLAANYFSDLNTGIILKNSSITVNNANFTYIRNEGFYPEAYMGSAIYAEANASLDNLLVDGFSGNTASITMNNCDFGVYTHDIAAATQAVTMTNVGVGVYGEANFLSKNLAVANCEIDAILRGIHFSSNPSAGHIYIAHNSVSTNDPEGVCIQVEDAMLNQNTSLEILENPVIDCFSSLGGIWVTNFVSSVIKWNNVNQFGFVQRDFSGILLTSCNKAEVSCNDVQGSGIDASKASSGIRLDQSGECIIHCNLVNQTNFGFTFNGACGSSNFADNEIQNHETGLQLNNVATIGNQPHQGNRWKGSYSSGFGAVNLGFLSGNFFQVHTTQPSVFHPVNNSAGWFTTNLTGIPYDCDNFDECNPDPLNRLLNTSLSLEQSIADGTFTTLDYVPESKSIAKQYLYARLEKDIVLRNQNSSLQSFYATQQNSSIGKLEQIIEEVNSLTYYDNLFSNALQATKVTTETILDSLKEIDSLRIVNSNDTLLDSLTISLKNQLNNAQQAIAQIVLQRELLLASDVTATKNNNAIIVSTEIPEQNKRAVNAIYLETIAVGNLSLNPSQINVLLPIAQQCPYSGGPSVYSARVMLKMAILNLNYDDNTVCWSQGIYRLANAQKQEKVDFNDISSLVNFTLLPNPAQDFVNVYYDGANSEKCILQITNSNGNEIAKFNLPNDKTMFTFKTDNFANGVYQISYTTSTSQSIKKLVIVR